MKLILQIVLLLGALIVIPRESISAESWRQLLAWADSLEKARNQDSAIVIGQRALEKTQTEFGGSDTATARVLYRIGVYYYDKANYDEADTLLHQALAIREKILGPDHQDVAWCLHFLADVYRHQLRYADAEPLYKKALLILGKALGSEHPDLYYSLHNLAILYMAQARYADAERLFKKALLIREKTLGPDHPEVGSCLNALGSVYSAQARYADAAESYKRALVIQEKALGPNNSNVAIILNNLALVYSDQARYADAEPLFKRALAIWEETLGSDHPYVATSSSNLANVYREQGRYADAELLHKRSLAINEKALGPDDPEVAKNLMNLANVYSDQARYADAEPLYKRAIAILEKALGANHPDVATCLSNLAAVYSLQARYADAELLFRRALAITEMALGPNHPGLAINLSNLASTYRANQQAPLGIALETRAFNVLLKNFRNNADVLSEKDALTYSQSVREESGYYLSNYVDVDSVSDEQLSNACSVVLESKGIVSEGIMQRQQALATEKDSVTLALVESLRTARLQISKLFSEGPGDDTSGAYKREVDSLSRSANDLEADLSRHSASFQRRQDLNNITCARIDSLLPASASLVEYLKWDYHQVKPDSLVPRYLALIVVSGRKPEIVNLGDASEIEPLLTRYLKHMGRVASAGHMPGAADLVEFKSISQAIYEKVWKPLEKHLKKDQTIFVGLDGSLNLISLASLLDEKGAYLTEKYVLHHVSTGRDLIRLKDRPAEGHGLFAIGDPDFDASIDARLKKTAESLLASTTPADAEYQTRNVRSGCGSLSDLKVEGLPYTHNEVEEARRLWQGKGMDSAVVFMGARATEDAFKSQARGKRVIHLATHGYYLTGQCAPKLVARHNFDSDEGFVGENPLLQSGLLLAGSNLHGAGCDSAHCEDGILSASEVAGMDLTGTDLVVLSACETGLGEVKVGEGVYGLRRAFQMAGARTVISSLWPVPDQATADVMSQLYGPSKKSLPERLRDLQLAQIKKLRASGLADHPYSWAAFIALGDWR